MRFKNANVQLAVIGREIFFCSIEINIEIIKRPKKTHHTKFRFHCPDHCSRMGLLSHFVTSTVKTAQNKRRRMFWVGKGNPISAMTIKFFECKIVH